MLTEQLFHQNYGIFFQNIHNALRRVLLPCILALLLEGPISHQLVLRCEVSGQAKSQAMCYFIADFHKMMLLEGKDIPESSVFISPKAKAITHYFHEVILFL